MEQKLSGMKTALSQIPYLNNVNLTFVCVFGLWMLFSFLFFQCWLFRRRIFVHCFDCSK